MPSLMKPLQPKKCLTMNSPPTPRFVALVLIQPPVPIYLDFRKNFFYGTKLGISMYWIQKVMQPIKANETSGIC